MGALGSLRQVIVTTPLEGGFNGERRAEALQDVIVTTPLEGGFN